MLQIGRHPTGHCQGLTRRAFVQAAAALPWAGTLLPQAASAAEHGSAKSVLLVWLWGGPSHLDTFDYKPDAPFNVRGSFSPIQTKLPGVVYSETLPRLAARNDQYALVRSNVNFQAGHLEAGTLALSCGTALTSPPEPSMGSILAKHRGYGALPPYMAVGNGPLRDVVGPVAGYGGGRWGKAWDPFMVKCQEDGQVEVPSLQLIEGQTVTALADRVKLRGELDQLRRNVEQTQQLETWDKVFHRAYDLLTSPDARVALDLSRESTATREAYGRTMFGQSCLLGRRLVEAGVPFVQVNWSSYVEAITPNTDFGWDTHIWNFDLLQDRHCPIFDRALAALLDDLRDRRLLDSTLVLVMGEFGRTPNINSQVARDHWPGCYFSLWSGGGVQPGRVVGKSDKTAAYPATTPITPTDVGATVMEAAGMSLTQRIEANVLANGRVVGELF